MIFWIIFYLANNYRMWLVLLIKLVGYIKKLVKTIKSLNLSQREKEDKAEDKIEEKNKNIMIMLFNMLINYAHANKSTFTLI